MAEKDRPLPKFGEWDVNDPASAEGFTVIFNKARDEKKTGGKPDSPAKDGSTYKPGATAALGKPQTVSNNVSYIIFICFWLWLWLWLNTLPMSCWKHFHLPCYITSPMP